MNPSENNNYGRIKKLYYYHKRIILVGLALLFTGLVVASAVLVLNNRESSDDESSQNQEQDITPQEAEESRDFATAASLYERELEKVSDEERAVVLNEIADNYFAAGDFQKAAEFYQLSADKYNEENNSTAANNALFYVELSKEQIKSNE